MPKEQKKKKRNGRPRSAGQHAEKYQQLYSSGRMAEKKLRRVLRHSGMAEAEKWAKERNAEQILNRLLQHLPVKVAKQG
jgi:precorrin-6x reductase